MHENPMINARLCKVGSGGHLEPHMSEYDYVVFSVGIIPLSSPPSHVTSHMTMTCATWKKRLP